MAHYRDLRELYARQMEFHGCGYALFQPISGKDMTPPCAGFFDRNGDWNLIANLKSVEQEQEEQHTEQFQTPVRDAVRTRRASVTRTGTSVDASSRRNSSTSRRGRSRDARPSQHETFTPLAYTPTKTAPIEITWQPKASLGVQQYNLEGSGSSPGNLPGGAETHIKYSTRSKFGAVLLTVKPVTLTAYNEERLFLQWLEDNRTALLERHADALKRYGLWLVTRTHTAQGCSINAWRDSGKAAIISAKAKASMLGELGENLDWSDQLTDRDWSHYRAKGPEGIVVFMDGINVKASTWWFDDLKLKLSGGREARSRSVSSLERRQTSTPTPQPQPNAQTHPHAHQSYPEHRSSLRIEEPTDSETSPPYRNSLPAIEDVPHRKPQIVRLHSNKQIHPGAANYYPQHAQYEYVTDASATEALEDPQFLRDVGLNDPLRRSPSSAKRSSYAGSFGSASPSLRRESRSISQEVGGLRTGFAS